MVRLREINTKSQFAFSPLSTCIAAATAAGSLSDDLSDEAKLELYDLDLDADDFVLRPKVSLSIPDRCRSIAWGGVVAGFSQGVIAVAMESSVDIYDAQALMKGKDALLTRGTAHTGAVRCLDFSEVQKNLLATAGTKGEFFVWDVTSKDAPTAYKSSRLDEIVSIAWNNKVGHILALGGKSGALSVWNMKNKAELIHIATRYPVSAIAWHPVNSTTLVTASADDAKPVIQVWDLQNANAPKQVLSGHERSVLSLAWCAADADLLLSSGADNRTLIWNPSSGQIVAELPTASQWVHGVGWCAKQPSIIANATLDGKLNIYSIQDTSTAPATAAPVETKAGDDFFDSIPNGYQAQTTSFTLKQTPAWLKRPISATFGFGGRLAIVVNNKVEITTYQASTRATLTAKDIKQTLSTKSPAELCKEQHEHAEGDDKLDWSVIQTLTAEDTRASLLSHIGFSKDEVNDKLGKEVAPAPSTTDTSGEDVDGDEFETIGQSYQPFKLSDGDETDLLITAAITSSRLDAAVDICLAKDRLTDAFMLAMCGSEADQAKVQKAYFAKTKVPYKRLLTDVIAHKLSDVIEHAELVDWKQSLALVCNYAKPEEFCALCRLLGQRLEDAGQTKDATLCYLAGSQLEHLVKIWQRGADARKEALLASGDEKAPFDVHVAQLGELMVKVQIFRKSTAYVDKHAKLEGQYALAELYSLYLEFANLLANEGDVSLAREYLDYVPGDFDGAEALKKRIAGPIATASTGAQGKRLPQQAAQRMPSQIFSPYAAQQQQPLQAVPPSPHSPAAQVQSAPSTRQTYGGPYTPAQTATPVTNNPYAPAGATSNAYAQPGAQSSWGGAGAYNAGPYGGGYSQTGQPPRVAPPPTGPSILPAAQRKDIPNWNDAPDLPTPPNRGRATPVIHRQSSQQMYGGSGVATPPYGAPSPAPGTSTAMPPPPPKNKSPGPPPKAVAPIGSTMTQATPPIGRRPSGSSPYAPPPTQAQQQQGAPPPRSPYQPSAPSPFQQGPPQGQSPYQQAPAPGQSPYQQAPPPAQAPFQQAPPQARSQYQPGPPQAQSPYQAGPPPAQQKPTYAPPPKAAPGSAPSSTLRSPVVSSGNAAPIMLSREPSQQDAFEARRQNHAAQSPADMKYPPGDRTHISDANRIIYTSLTEEMDRFSKTAIPKYQKPMQETIKKMNVLFDQLNNGVLTDGTLEQLKGFAAALIARDYNTAYNIQKELAQDKMHECREYIVGIKTLIAVGKNTP